MAVVNISGHNVIAPALQKYYSALRSLEEFGMKGNLFDDIACLDTFFSEFRNITFVIQKGLDSDTEKEQYETLRNKFLVNNDMKWFIDVRNRTAKERPFQLNKELIIDLYLLTGTIRLSHSDLIISYDENFEAALSTIKQLFIEHAGLIELFFSSKIVFKEEGQEIEFYPKIKYGLSQMRSFLDELQKALPCECEYCQQLRKSINKIYNSVYLKELSFTKDYSYEKGLSIGEHAYMYVSDDNEQLRPISDFRVSLDNPIYGEAKDDITALFDIFIVCHVIAFQKQNHKIMPVFMVVYEDKTYQMIPFEATSKATLYRIVNEIAEQTVFEEVDAIFFCGELFVYSADRFDEVNRTPYSERKKTANQELLAFRALLKGGNEIFLSFDEQYIDDMQYVAEQIKRKEKPEDSPIDWLKPIKEKLKNP